MIIALAGRRIDAIDAKQLRFSPAPESIELVRNRMRATFISQRAIALVSSAACGADLLALSEAGLLNMRRRIVLPFSRAKFRTTSVTDRPGDWGKLYDDVLDEVEPQGDLLIIEANSDDSAYAETNHRIIQEAQSLGNDLQHCVSAVRVWEGQSRGAGDLTEEFGIYAQKKGIPVMDVMTI